MVERFSAECPTLFEVAQAEKVFRTAYNAERADNSQNLAIRLALAAVWAAGRKYQKERCDNYEGNRKEDLPATV